MQDARRVGDGRVLTAVVPAHTSAYDNFADFKSSPLDTAQRSLETSDRTTCQLAYDTYGSIDHHDGFAPSLQKESQFRHSSWAAPRRRIYQALLRTGASCRRVQHFADCGSSLWLLKDGQQLELACNNCHDRLCIPCQKSRQAALVEGIILRMIDSDAECRFLTLTLKHSDAPLAVQLERLIAAFKSLRKHPEIAPSLSGGAWFIEIKLSKDKARWHPHLHVIAAGSYIDARTLSHCWLQVTGDSYITDIRAIGNIKDRAAYVTKYATKPLHNEVTLVPEKLDEFVVAIKGRRLYQCFGTWAQAVKKSPAPKRTLTPVGRLTSVHSDACTGDIQSLVYMHQVHARWPRTKTLFPLPPQLEANAPLSRHIVGAPAPP